MIWIPLGVFVATTAALALLFYFFPQNRHALQATRFRRRVFAATKAMLALAVTLFLKATSFEAFQSRTVNFSLTDAIYLSLALFFGLVAIWQQMIEMTQAESDRDELSKLQEEDFARRREQKDLVLLLNVFSGAIHTKGKGVQDAIVAKQSRESAQLTVEDLARALSPDRQMRQILKTTYLMFRKDLKEDHAGTSMRLALFTLVGNQLRLDFSWDGERSSCLNTPKVNPAQYGLDKINDCLAVRAVLDQRVYSIGDAESANQDRNSAFHYFEEAQRQRIRSLAAIPLTPRTVGGLGPC